MLRHPAQLKLIAALMLWQLFTPVPAAAQTSDTTSGTTKPLFEDADQPLFSAPLFSSGPLSTRLDQDVQPTTSAIQMQTQIVALQREAILRADYEMRRQMRSVARYLSQYCQRNHSEFPGTAGEEQEAVIVQLAQLIPTNPYAAAAGSGSGSSYGLATMYDADGSALSTNMIWNGSGTGSSLSPSTRNRIRLVMDYSLEPSSVPVWKTTALPDGWNAAPGTITAVGNNEGFFVVWGAGADGRPVKESDGSAPYLVPVTISGTGADQEPPNAY